MRGRDIDEEFLRDESSHKEGNNNIKQAQARMADLADQFRNMSKSMKGSCSYQHQQRQTLFCSKKGIGSLALYSFDVTAIAV